MWSISASAQTSAPVEAVWAAYLDVASWPQWDAGLAFYRPNGPFAAGTEGVLQPVGGPELPFSITRAEPNRCFDDRTPISPDAAILGRHELIPLGAGTRIVHHIEIDGPDSEEMAVAMGFKQEELQATVDSLARYVEGKSHA